MRMDERDRAILLAVWDGATGFNDLLRRTGFSNGSVNFRLTGTDSRGAHRRGGGLLKTGWLQKEERKGRGRGIDNTLRPGPRFGGVLRNTRTGERRPLEVLEAYP